MRGERDRAHTNRLVHSGLAEAARLADEGCPFSALLKRSGATVDARAELA